MATKPKAILSTHDGREASPITKASNVLFENGQTAQDILNDRQDTMISPVIENSSPMFKVGQGDNVDYSANVVNGAYESMVLKGKTMVNCIQEPSSQDVVLPYEFEDGQYVTINDTKESGALGVELKGQTLVNMAKNKSCDKSNAVGEVNISAKPNTTYIAFFDGTYDKEATAVNFAMFCTSPVYVENTAGMNGDGLYTATVNGHGGNEHRWNPSLNYTKFTTSSNQNYIHIRTGGGKTNIKYDNMRIFEYQEGMENWDIPYFEGMQSVQAPSVTTVGKNLFDLSRMNESSYIGYNALNEINLEENSVATTNRNSASTGRGYVITGLKIGVPYTITATLDESSNTTGYFQIGNRQGTGYYEQRQEFTPGQTKSWKVYSDVGSLRLAIAVAHDVSNQYIKFKNIQIEESPTPTTYESYKSSILSLPEEVVLRSLPNGVCDTFNTRTGEYVKRIGEIVLNGSEGWASHSTGTVNGTAAYRYRINVSNMLITNQLGETPQIFCDKLPCVRDVQEEIWSTVPSILRRIASDYGAIYIVASASTVNAFKQWLSQNPVTVQYELETPIVTKINLPSTLKSWNTTTHIYSEIPENTLYPILSHSNPTYPVILKPSTKYSIVANSYSNSHTNSPINFNLGGATTSTTVGNRVTTITTPSTLSNELLTMSGRGNKLNNVMVIEGDVVADEPYFEGICDCKSPILSNVGKNLLDINYLVKSANTDNIYIDGDGSLVVKGGSQYIEFKTSFNVAFSFDQVTTGSSTSASIMEVLYDDGRSLHLASGTTGGNKNGSYKTNSNRPITHFRFNNWCGGTTIFKNFICTKLGNDMTYEPYKSNILSCTNGIVKLTEDMFEQGTTAQYTANIGKTYQWMKENSTPSYDARRLRTKSLIKIEPNTKLILQNTDNFMYAMSGYGVDKLSLGTFDTSWVQNTTITIPQDVYYIGFSIRKKDDTGITINDFKNTKFTLSEVDKTIVLRSLPNGVCDTLNVETGEYVQRIGDYTVNGTETSWFTYIDTTGVNNNYLNQTSCAFGVHLTGKAKGNGILCDKLPTRSIGWWGDKHTGEGICGIDGDNRIFLRVKNEKTGVLYTDNASTALEKAKRYLASNPVTVQYELATPIVSTIDVQGFPFSYENGHVQLSSGSIEQSLTPKVEYSVATNRNGQIRSNQKMVERHQKQLDQLQAIILANLVNSQYNQTLTTLKYELSRV